jgi:hypothetical protein
MLYEVSINSQLAAGRTEGKGRLVLSEASASFRGTAGHGRSQGQARDVAQPGPHAAMQSAAVPADTVEHGREGAPITVAPAGLAYASFLWASPTAAPGIRSGGAKPWRLPVPRPDSRKATNAAA